MALFHRHLKMPASHRRANDVAGDPYQDDTVQVDAFATGSLRFADRVRQG